MVFRKPYAFLIKNFKKIHFILLIFWGIVFYKIWALKKFMSDFIIYGVYNRNLEGIGTKIDWILYLSTILMIIISVALLVLLLYKKKPWKIYLIIILEYIVMIYTCGSITSYFNSYTIITPVSSSYFYRDLLNIVSWIQYLVLIVLLLRITGLDIKKFGFSSDKEFLELNSSDREEFEVSIEIDKHSFKRKYNQLKRNIRYFYYEHKLMCILSFVIIVVSSALYTAYYFGIKTRSYKVGDKFTAGIYDITINSIYVTDKDALGRVIEEGSKFVILNVNMKNNSNVNVKPDFSRFHLMNATSDKTNIVYYDDYFKDLGDGVLTNNTLNSKEQKDFVLVYKVSNKLNNDKFVLFYQEYNGVNDTYLRRIKLSLTDISKVNNSKSYDRGQLVSFKTNSETTEITFENFMFGDSFTYSKYVCTDSYRCSFVTRNLVSSFGSKILRIDFASSDWEGKEFIDFTSRCAIIKYVDTNGKEHTYDIVDMVGTDYSGKSIFIKVSDDIVNALEVYLDYIIRDKEYKIKIK